jgi:2-polyprenyl-3-methyl-5-hydroxy-6-metoxy-1,4-benzoquinol methylase
MALEEIITTKSNARNAHGAQSISAGLETVDCNFCGSSDYSLYDSLGEWRIVKCRQCGYCFTNPRPTAETLPSFYPIEYFKDEEKRPGLVRKDGSFKVAAEMDYRNRIVDIESHLVRRGSLLEIGPGTGAFLKVMQNRGWVVRGVELSVEAAEAARVNEQVDVFCGSLEEYKTDRKYDVICMYQSLEHVSNPAYVIKRSYELLNDGGLVFIEVPNLNGFDIKRDISCRSRIYDLPIHLSHFSPSVLARKLKAVGFKVIDVDCYYPNLILKLFEQRERVRSVCGNGYGKITTIDRDALSSGSEPAQAMTAKTSTWKTRLLKSVSKILPGWRFTIVARK